MKEKQIFFNKTVQKSKIMKVFSKFHETWPKRRSRPMHLCGRFAKRNNNCKLVRKGNKLSLITPCKTSKFWTFSEFHETWPKRWSRPMHLCGKFVKCINNYKVVWKENKLSLIKPCKTAKFWTFPKFHKT